MVQLQARVVVTCGEHESSIYGWVDQYPTKEDKQNADMLAFVYAIRSREHTTQELARVRMLGHASGKRRVEIIVAGNVGRKQSVSVWEAVWWLVGMSTLSLLESKTTI